MRESDRRLKTMLNDAFAINKTINKIKLKLRVAFTVFDSTNIGGFYMFENTKESRFFTKSEYDFIGYDFNFEALEELTSLDFVNKIKDNLGLSYIFRFFYEDVSDYLFLYFYAENDDLRNNQCLIINATHNKKDYFSVNVLRQRQLEKLGLSVTKNDIEEVALDNVNEIINTLQRNDKVFLDDGSSPYEGYVVRVDEESITINIYVPDINKTFQRDDIVEISVI